MILDEPTVGVDARNVSSFYQMFRDLNKNGYNIILVTHDIGAIIDKVTHVVCLNKHLHFHGETEEFEKRKNGMSEAYGYDLHMLSHRHGHERAMKLEGISNDSCDFTL